MEGRLSFIPIPEPHPHPLPPIALPKVRKGGGGATLNGQPISVSSTSSLGSALIATGERCRDDCLPFAQLRRNFPLYPSGKCRGGKSPWVTAYVYSRVTAL